MKYGDMPVSLAGKIGGHKRGKQLKGVGNPNAKLTPENVQTIRDCQGWLSAERLGEIYRIHPEHVRKIWRGEYWNG